MILGKLYILFEKARALTAGKLQLFYEIAPWFLSRKKVFSTGNSFTKEFSLGFSIYPLFLHSNSFIKVLFPYHEYNPLECV